MRDRTSSCLTRLLRVSCALSVLTTLGCLSDPFDPAATYGIASIQVTPESATVSSEPSIFTLDGTADLSIALFDDSSRSISVGIQPKWASSDPSVARVTGSGTVIGVQPGQAKITATIGSVHGYSTVTVVPVADTGLIIAAHRGFRSVFPENTLVAIAGAFEWGADAVEIDVQQTIDKVPILMHDPTVNRTTNGTGAVQSLTLADIEQLDACSKFGSAWNPCSVPTLAEALETARGHGLLILHLKGSYSNAELASIIDMVRSKGMSQRVLLASDSYGTLGLLRQMDSGIPVGLFTTGSIPSIPDIARLDRAVVMPDYQTLLANPRATFLLLHSAASEHTSILVWTFATVEDAKAMVALGVRVLLTDIPLDRSSLQ